MIDKQLLEKFGILLKEYCSYLNRLQIPIAQYRNKEGSAAVIAQDLKLIKSIYTGQLIVNDYIEFIELADGVHIGQDDLKKFHSNSAVAVKMVREKVGSKIVGLSTHDKDEVQQANGFKELDYIGLGSYRNTTTKSGVRVGGQKLLEIAAKSLHKVALIGGITMDDNFSSYSQISYRVIGSHLMQSFQKSF